MGAAWKFDALRESFRRSWKYLVGVAVLPPFMVLGDSVGVPFVVLAIPFFLVMAVAMWPWLSGREPYSFWVMAVVVWLASGAVTAIVFKVVSAIAV
jgi:hypothetical protein